MISRLALLAVLALAGCREPTEIVVEVATNLDCASFGGAAVAVGPVASIGHLPASSHVDGACGAGGYVGKLVVTPSGAKDEALGFEIVGANGASWTTCGLGDPKGADPATRTRCVFARRALRFEANRSLHVPVSLDADCLGISCDDPTTTCQHGTCVSATVTCDDTGSCPTPVGDGGPPKSIAACPDWPSLEPSPYPMQGICPSRRNQSPIVAGGAAHAHDVVDTGMVIAPPVVLADGSIVYEDGFGYLAFYRGIGAIERPLPSLHGSHGNPILARASEPRIVVREEEVNQLALADRTGKPVVAPCAGCTDAVLDKKGLVYVGTASGAVQLDPATLTPTGKKYGTNAVTVAPSFTDDERLVVVGVDAMGFTTVELFQIDGALVASVPVVKAPALAPPVVAPMGTDPSAPVVWLTAGAQNQVAALWRVVAQPSGNVRSSSQQFGCTGVFLDASRPVVGDDGRVYVASCTIGAPAWYAYDASGGYDPTHDGPTGFGVTSPPILDRTGHVFAVEGSSARLLDASGVRAKANVAAGARLLGSPILLADGSFAAADDQGGLHFLGLQ